MNTSKNGAKRFIAVFLLSLLFISTGGATTIIGQPESTEVVETVLSEQEGITWYDYCSPVFKKEPSAEFVHFNFDIFLLEQDSETHQKYLRQQQLLYLQSYIQPIKKIIPFSLKEPFYLHSV